MKKRRNEPTKFPESKKKSKSEAHGEAPYMEGFIQLLLWRRSQTICKEENFDPSWSEEASVLARTILDPINKPKTKKKQRLKTKKKKK